MSDADTNPSSSAEAVPPLSNACVCGKRHRVGTVCRRAQREALLAAQAQEVVEVLRRVPSGTTILHDTRRGRATARTLEAGGRLARRFCDGCEDADWGEVQLAEDGTVVRFSRDLGGYVPNSYAYATETDELHVVAAEARVAIMVDRVRAQSRPHGEGTAQDRLPPHARLAEAVARGERYGSAYLAALREAWRLHCLVRADLDSLSPAEAIARDFVLEVGWVEVMP
jgi:hypothetical protein